MRCCLRETIHYGAPTALNPGDAGVKPGTPGAGDNPHKLLPGEIFDFPDEVAAGLIARGLADAVAEAPAAEPKRKGPGAG